MLNVNQFVKEVNTLRLQNQNCWYCWDGIVEGKKVKIKAYNTWLQVFIVDGLRIPCNMDMKPIQFKQALKDAIY